MVVLTFCEYEDFLLSVCRTFLLASSLNATVCGFRKLRVGLGVQTPRGI